MKILDRYILRQFLWNYLIALTVLIGMFVVMDMVFKFDSFVVTDDAAGAAGAGRGLGNAVVILRDIGDYYFYQSFLIFTQLSGIIPVVAAAFTLLRLSRFNELTAALAAGVPMLRLAVPIVVAAVLLNGVLVADQELILPRMIPKLVRKQSDVKKGVGRQYALPPMPVGDHSELLAALYDPGTSRIETLDVVWLDDADRPVRHLRADAAEWDPGANLWRLTNGLSNAGFEQGQPMLPATSQATYAGVTPDEITLYHDRKSSLVDLLSTGRLNQLIAKPKSYAVGGLYRIKYLRLAQPIMNVVLLLLTIPAVLTFDPKALKPAATRCLTLTGLAMGTVFVCQQMAGQPPLGPGWVGTWPALMAFVPIIIWLPVAVVLLERVRT